jgi:hypothetical protein
LVTVRTVAVDDSDVAVTVVLVLVAVAVDAVSDVEMLVRVAVELTLVWERVVLNVLVREVVV